MTPSSIWTRLTDAIAVLRGKAHATKLRTGADPRSRTTTAAPHPPAAPAVGRDAATNFFVHNTGIPHGVLDIASNLPHPHEQVEPITVHISGFVLPHGSAMLAAWRQTLVGNSQCRISLDQCVPATKRFLENSGLISVLTENNPFPRLPAFRGRLPLRAVSNLFEAGKIVDHIGTTFFGDYAEEVRSAVMEVMSELCNNVMAHSATDRPGYICGVTLKEAQSDGQPRPVAHVAIADTGIGIRGSYEGGQNTNARELVTSGSSALLLAINGMYSSRRRTGVAATMGEDHYGSGLFVVRKLIERNGGSMYLLSGRESVYLRPDRGGRPFEPTPKVVPREYEGTFVGLKFYLDGPLPINEVREEFAELLVGRRLDGD